MTMRLLFLLVSALPAIGLGSVFDAPEPEVASSPSGPVQVRLPNDVRVIDSDVSPTGPLVALLLSNEIRFWKIGDAQPAKVFDVPAGFNARSITWHPRPMSSFFPDLRDSSTRSSGLTRKMGLGSAEDLRVQSHVML